MNITIAKFEQCTKIVKDCKNVRHFNKNYNIIINEITVKINRDNFLFQLYDYKYVYAFVLFK